MARVSKPSAELIREAAQHLRNGRVVAFPTETVYGLGADTFNPEALRRVYELKGRPLDNPLIAHVLDVPQAKRVAAGWNDRCDLLAQRFWPGPLTLVVTKASDVPDEATAGLPTIAVRSPSHAVARELLKAFGSPISAPSANRSGHVSPTNTQHVADDFADAADLLIIDGGPCDIGIESTVLDVTSAMPRVLRPGSITAEQLRAVLGEVASQTITQQSASPGTATLHYAPHTPALLVSSDELSTIVAKDAPLSAVICFDASHIAPPHRAIQMPADPAAYAARLYEALRQADAIGAKQIIIEKPPHSSELWAAIHDRLRRATAQQKRQ